MIMYVYNMGDYPISVNDVKKLISRDSSCAAVGIGGDALFLPKQWISTADLDQTMFHTSYVSGKIRSLIEKGYLRVLSSDEYRKEINTSRRENDLAIPKENVIPQGLGIYSKAIKDIKNSSSYDGLIEEDDAGNFSENIEEEVQEEKPVYKNDDRFDRIENAILSLSSVIKDFMLSNSSNKRVTKNKVTKSSTKKSVKKVSKRTKAKKSK